MRSMCRAFAVGATLSLVMLVFAGPALGAHKPGHHKPKADTVYLNGNIYTVDKHFNRAQAMAVQGDRFLAVGKNKDVQKYIGRDTTIINLKGKTVFPGLWDAHLHFSGVGSSRQILDLNGLSKEAIVAKVKAAADAAQPDEWIQGGGWNQTLWDPPVMPTAADLDAVSPNNPVRLGRTDGHATWVNSVVLGMSTIPAPGVATPGGEIFRYPDGTPTGVFVDTAQSFAKSAPPSTESQVHQSYLLAQDYLFSLGNTSVCDMGAAVSHIDRMKTMYEAGEMKIRVNEYVTYGSGPTFYDQPASERIGLFGNRYTINGIKISIDGALGSYGAYLMEPYSDRTDGWRGSIRVGNPYYDASGNVTTTPDIPQIVEHIAPIYEEAVKHGFQVASHAIGDATNRAVLGIAEKVERDLPKLTRDPRFRDEHAQIVAVEDIPRFAQLHVIPSMQAQHATQDLTMAESRVGPVRILGAYAWRSFIDSGSVIADGSDASVEVPNPWWGLFSAVTRINKNGYNNGEPWYPQQCMTREEALRSFTIWSAYAAFATDKRGSIENDKLADFVIVGYPQAGEDYMTMPAWDIWQMQSNMTVVGGETVYTAPGFDILQ